MNKVLGKLDYYLKHSNTFNKIFVSVASFGMRFMGLFVPMKDNMVLFTGHSRKYNDSTRAIYEKMVDDPRFANYIFVWALDDVKNTDIPGNPILIKSDTVRYFITSLRAKYWIACVNIERGLRYKKKKCVYLNTWHGVCINNCGNSVPGRNDFNWSHIDYVCYESEYNKKILMEDFLVREDAMIPTGLPRNDALYNTTNDEILEIKKSLNLPLDKKIILYAPTWRDSTDSGDSYSILPPIDLKLWKEYLGKDYILLMRTHAYTSKLLGIEFDEFCRDMISYPSVNDIFKVSDILISDYSSCITDYSILERPIICFAYDYEQYREKRGLKLDMEKAMPSGVKRTEKEVIDQILNMNYEEECQKTRDMIKNKLTYIGGHAAELCIEKVFSK